MTMAADGIADAPVTAVDVADAKHRRHPLQWVAGLVTVAIVAGLAYMLATNTSLQWGEVVKYFTVSSILRGLWTTVWLTVVAMALGIAGGVLLAAARLSRNPLVKSAANAYVWFFRGTPLLVQLTFWYNAAIFLPIVKIPLPGGHALIDQSTNTLITPLIAAVLGLALNEAAYMCEVVRGGLISVSPGQSEAAQSLGLSRGTIFRRIVLPQAMRAIVPPTGNQVIGMLKGTSLVSVIAVSDLLYSSQAIYAVNGRVIPLLVVASLWYLVCTSVLYVIQARLEKRFGRGAAPRSTGGARLRQRGRRVQAAMGDAT